MTKVMNEYNLEHWHKDQGNRMANRDALLAMFSDARVAAPVIQTAASHASKNLGNTFLYVFQHVTKYGYYPEASCTLVLSLSSPLYDDYADFIMAVGFYIQVS